MSPVTQDQLSVPVTVSANQVIATGIRALYGYSICESTGSAAAKVRLRESSATGKMLAIVALASGASSTQYFPEQAPGVTSGSIYVEVVSGSVEGVLYVG
jgi:hypothetical protein